MEGSQKLKDVALQLARIQEIGEKLLLALVVAAILILFVVLVAVCSREYMFGVMSPVAALLLSAVVIFGQYNLKQNVVKFVGLTESIIYDSIISEANRNDCSFESTDDYCVAIVSEFDEIKQVISSEFIANTIEYEDQIIRIRTVLIAGEESLNN